MSQFMSSKYFDVLEALLDNNPEISWSAYKDRMAELGCDTLLYVYVDTITPEADENAFIYKSTVSDRWFEHYFKEDHHLLDHVFQRRTISGIETPLWLGSEVKQPEGFENKHFSEHSSQAGQAGFRACINYKMSNNARRADSDIFAMTIGTTGTTDDLKNSLASNGREIRLLTNLMHTRMSYNIASSALKSLTPREKECLRWIAAGLRVDRISYKLGVSNSAVSFHLKNARDKLKAKTLAEAVAIATRLRIFDM